MTNTDPGASASACGRLLTEETSTLARSSIDMLRNSPSDWPEAGTAATPVSSASAAARVETPTLRQAISPPQPPVPRGRTCEIGFSCVNKGVRKPYLPVDVKVTHELGPSRVRNGPEPLSKAAKVPLSAR